MLKKEISIYRLYKIVLYLVFTTLLLVSVFSLLLSRNVAPANNYYKSSANNEITSENIEIVSVRVDSTNQDSMILECKQTANDYITEFKSYLGSLKTVVIHSDTTLRRGLANSSSIYIRCLEDKQEFINVLIHEIGHVIDLGYLVGSDSSFDTNFYDFSNPVKYNDPSYNFYRISWNSNTEWVNSADSNAFVSRYASTDPFEDFAESFMMYVLYGDLFLEMANENVYLEKKYNYFKYVLFDGSEFTRDIEVNLYSYGLDLNKIRLFDATQIHRFLAINL